MPEHPSGGRWIGAVESYYGTPLASEARLELVSWLGSHGYNAYAYGPKDDPFHRERWREPYPDDKAAELRALVETGKQAGVAIALGLSPGLDWRDGDEDALVAKLATFRDLGAPVLAIAWDDVPPGGAELGATHGRATARAVEKIGTDASWMAVPCDYATEHATAYLRAFADELPDHVEIAWTGPSIVSPRVTADHARRLAGELGRKLLFAENFPVNDGPMSGVLHIGPYPQRPPDLVDEVSGVFCNFMPNMPIASRIGLGVAARFWREPGADREQAWRDVVAEFPGLEPLARSCRSWLTEPGPDPELVAWAESADPRLLSYLQAGCRKDLDPALEREVEPWLERWEREAMAMQVAILAIGYPDPKPPGLAFTTAVFWEQARRAREQVFGIRFAMYPVTKRIGDAEVVDEAALVTGENLTDMLCRRATSG